MIKRILHALFSVLLLSSLITPMALAQDNGASGSAGIFAGAGPAGTWFETAYATWTGNSESGYRVYVRTLGAYDWRDNSPITGWLTEWEEVDAPLVRKVDSIRNTWRVDVPGLPRGTYEIQVRAADGVTVLHTFTNLETWSFPRHGAAFVPSYENPFEGSHPYAPNGATGGYLPDGRVHPDAITIYVTHENMKETLPPDVFTANRGSTPNERTPLVIRFLGKVGSFETVSSSIADSGTVGPPGLNNNRMLSVGQGNGNVTFEGIGPDATIYGWGISTGGAHNVVIRNLTFDQWYEDAIEINGLNTGTRGSHVWVHNNTFGYGQNKHLALNQDPDQAKGDGATDVTNHARNYTISYNKYAGSSKVLLIGGGAGSISAHYGTIHHNWFLGTEERTPRVRNGRIHVFNNLYQDIQGHPYHDTLLNRYTGYGIGAAHNATIWAEGNIFENVNFPFLRSRQGHARGHDPIDSTSGSGFNHFFGDAPGFIITREVVTEGDFPASLDGFRQSSDYMPGVTEEALQDLRNAALSLQPNVLDEASRRYFDPKLDIGVVVAKGSTTTNPNMTTNPPAQLDWSFRPNRDGVWPTETPEQVEALRKEIETYSGTMPRLAPTEAPAAPEITSVKINEEVRSAYGGPDSFIPAPGKIVVYPGTFTIEWQSNDVLAEQFVIQWDQGKGSGNWQTIGTVQASARPNRFITQQIDVFAHLQAILAQADSKDAAYTFRIKAVNSFGESDWSKEFHLTNTYTGSRLEMPGSRPLFDLADNESISALKAHLEDKIRSAQEPVTFRDVSGHWAAQSIQVFTRLGIVKGYEDGTFKPNAPITRGEFAAIVARIFPMDADGGLNVSFTDVQNSWAREAILTLASKGILNGYEDGTFRPDKNITRAEMVAIMSRIVNLEAFQGAEAVAFTDIADSWNRDQIMAAARAGIIKGMADGSFAPNQNSTRAEALTILLRTLQLNPELASLLASL